MSATLMTKLQLKPGQKLHLQNAPKDVQAALARELPLVERGPADAVLLVVNNLEEARKQGAKMVKAAPKGSLMWVAYPKGTSKVKTDVNRDTLRGVFEALGWDTVRAVAIDETWSALRFRPTEEVGT